MLQKLRSRARTLRLETQAVYLATLDSRTPWVARALLLLIVAYALSPIDLIPDFIPVLGYLDDLILIPAGIALALRLIPAEVMAQARATAAQSGATTRIGVIGAVVIAALWILAIIILVAWVTGRLAPPPQPPRI